MSFGQTGDGVSTVAHQYGLRHSSILGIENGRRAIGVFSLQSGLAPVCHEGDSHNFIVGKFAPIARYEKQKGKQDKTHSHFTPPFTLWFNIHAREILALVGPNHVYRPLFCHNNV